MQRGVHGFRVAGTFRLAVAAEVQGENTKTRCSEGSSLLFQTLLVETAPLSQNDRAADENLFLFD